MTKDQDFNRKVDEISQAYEAIKDAMYQSSMFINKYEFERAYENLVKLRDIAATSVVALYKPSEQ